MVVLITTRRDSPSIREAQAEKSHNVLNLLINAYAMVWPLAPFGGP